MTHPIDEVIATIRRGTDASPHVLFGPIQRSRPGIAALADYHFVVFGADGGDLRVSCLNFREREPAETVRRLLIMKLGVTEPVVVHDLDNEMELVRVCDRLWPSAKTKRLLAVVEAERGPAGHA